MNDLFKPVMTAYKQGFQELQDTFRVERDPALRVYEKLQSSDFSAIQKKYGPDATAAYIQTMEARRLKRR